MRELKHGQAIRLGQHDVVCVARFLVVRAVGLVFGQGLLVFLWHIFMILLTDGENRVYFI